MTKLFPIQATDYPSLAAFCSTFPGENLSSDMWERRFKFWWEENPVFTPDWVRGWVLLDGSRVAGMLADIPSRIQLLGHEVTVSNISTLRILPMHRKETSFFLETLLAHARARPVFNTTSNPEMAAVLRSFRFRNLAEYFVEHLFVTDASFLARQLQQKKRLPWVLAFPVARITRLTQQLRCRTGISKMEGLQVRILENSGPEFDRLWQKTDQLFSFTNRRMSCDLQWIVRANPVRHLILFGCYDQNETLVGYGLFVRCPEEYPAKSFRLVCLDLWSERLTMPPYIALIRAAIRFSEQNHLSMTVVPQYDEIIGRAASLSGFPIRRTKPAAIYCRFPRGVTLGINSEKSRLSGYLGDAVL
ncbi:MAG: hypothetical protein HQL63_01175 [Magnetococcales bacterium]|nr:hypothetical protein [Magnetococcales bacterium]MBF0322779.1 hypothetical protein [Magnetococcales bacterium]